MKRLNACPYPEPPQAFVLENAQAGFLEQAQENVQASNCEQMRDCTEAPASRYAWQQAPQHAWEAARERVREGSARERVQENPDLESWVGRNAVGVVASVLVFLGLVALAATVVPQLSDEAKVALMFAFSGLLAIVGSIVAVRRMNGFTSALMGCGMGSLFISVLVTHLYFGMIGEFLALGIVLLWMVACLVLLGKTQSSLLSIVLQLGLAVSVCVGYAGDGGALGGGVEELQQRLPLLLGYQLAASAIVIGGSLLLYRKAYRSSLVLALALSCVASSCMWSAFRLPVRWGSADSGFLCLVAVAFGIQALASAVLAVLAVASFSKEERHARPYLAVVALLVALAAQLDVGETARRLATAVIMPASTGFALGYHPMTVVADLVVLGIVAAFALLLMRNMRMRGVAADDPAIAPALMASLVVGALIAAHPGMSAPFSQEAVYVPWMWLWSAFALHLAERTGNRAYYRAALVFVALDAVYLAAIAFPDSDIRYGSLIAAELGAVCTVLVGGMALLALRTMEASGECYAAYAVGCTMLVMSYLFNCTPLAAEAYQWSICCMSCALVCVVAGFAFRLRGVRLYGLILALACVAKLVTFDMAGLDSPARAAALVAGGLICFAISALYNFAVKRLDVS